jgi:glutaminyl-tRNA synthetase
LKQLSDYQRNNMESKTKVKNFITDIIEKDINSGKNGSKVATRFPPEPNGYLHIGHAKSICLNFGLAEQYGGTTNLRFDDTNPVTEDVEFKDSIAEDVHWLGFKCSRMLNASDYFEDLYKFAVYLIKNGKAYVCSLTSEDVRAYRGTLTEPGKNSPFRERSVEENLRLFEDMKNGKYSDGAHTLRAKIDMASPNINLRDPAIYRIRHANHHQTGDRWCIYPMYDYAHGISDAIEGITHSICTLEFEDHRPLYDWFLDQLPPFETRPQQIEFARLNLNYTVMSKRKLKKLVQEGYVSGWNDPRMPTIAGLRRRGYTPASIRDFAERIGVTRADNIVDVGVLEFCIRSDLEKKSPRAMCVINPLKVRIKSFQPGETHLIDAQHHPQDPHLGSRKLVMTDEIYIERDDFLENPPKDFFRLGPGREVRLRHSFIIKCEEVVKDQDGNVVELICSHDPSTLGKNPSDGRKVKGIIHWVPQKQAIDVEVRLYDRLFNTPNPNDTADGQDFTNFINPQSLQIVKGAKLEPGLSSVVVGQSYQFERLGYFCLDQDSTPKMMVWNRTVSLKDSWTKPGV